MNNGKTGERVASPSKVSAWLECEHYLNLRNQVDDGLLAQPDLTFSPFAQLLADKGFLHESECLDHFKQSGLTVYEVPDKEKWETFDHWVERVGNPMADGPDVVFQMPFSHHGMRGVADFLMRVVSDDGAMVSYEPVDAKLTRKHAKSSHVLQLCFYAEAVEALTGVAPEMGHIFLGSGEYESVLFCEVDAYWRRLRKQLSTALVTPPDGSTRPEPCSHCDFCEFAEHCNTQWRAEDSLVFVTRILPPHRHALEEAGVSTLDVLANFSKRSIPGLDADRLARLKLQASLQLQARNNPDEDPPYLVLDPEEPDFAGLEGLPKRDKGDVFLDYEGHPFWTPKEGLFFLFGFLHKGKLGRWEYQQHWAHDKVGEAKAAGELVDYLHKRLKEHPKMHVYHYNHTEVSELEKMVDEHGLDSKKLEDLVDARLFVDLYEIVRHSVVAGVESYGLKNMERLAGFTRSAGIEKGAGAVIEYEDWMADKDPSRLQKIASYNEDDVRATLAVRDWLVKIRPSNLPWHDLIREREQSEVDDLSPVRDALLAHPEGSPEKLLGYLVDYWLRERRKHTAEVMVRLHELGEAALDNPLTLTGLYDGTLVPPEGRKKARMRFSFPKQGNSYKWFDKNPGLFFLGVDGEMVGSSIATIDRAAGTVEVIWGDGPEEADVIPTTVTLNGWVSNKPKFEALVEVAKSALAAKGHDASRAILARDLPRFKGGPGPGPVDGVLGGSIDEICTQVANLDHSFLAIQGPPGTGKTWTGARIIQHLVRAGLRVGISAFSHKAIDNLLKEVVEVFSEAGEISQLSVARRGGDEKYEEVTSVKCVASNAKCVDPADNVVAGTTWVFASSDLRDNPVDVLLIDEAGQMGLADALAAAAGAKNVVLLGDPQQLPQVIKAAHPGGSKVSVLEHILGDHLTIESTRGVFLGETRRMHPDICAFISNNFYEGRLSSFPTCAVQNTVQGTGLRLITAEHDGCSSESPVEAALVVETIAGLIGSAWTNAEGISRPLTAADFIVVAPYNDQVNFIEHLVKSDKRVKGVAVGTVDKFQGQEAPVVLYSMTTSESGLIPRTTDFLFSQNRLNVAISRARGLVFLICTDELLSSRARSVGEMKPLSTLCAFAEEADRQQLLSNS